MKVKFILKSNICIIMVIFMLLALSTTACNNSVKEPTIDIWTAAAQGNLNEIESNIAYGQDINSKEPYGGSAPLNIAAISNQKEAVKLLINNGADINIKDNQGTTPLYNAAYFCIPEMVELLLEKGADPKIKSNAGLTPFEIVSIEWNDGLEESYIVVGAALGFEFDLDWVKSARPQIADIIKNYLD